MAQSRLKAEVDKWHDFQPDPDAHRRLGPGDVRYLALKGGGGKAWAFLGVLTAFTHQRIPIMVKYGDTYRLNFERIQGVAGTSGGGLIGSLAAVGFTLKDLFRMVSDRNSLKKFFDPAYYGHSRSYLPIATRKGTNPTVSRQKASPDGSIGDGQEKLRSGIYYEIPSDEELPVSLGPFDLYISGAKHWFIGEDELKKLAPTYAKHFNGHVKNLLRDGGLSSGLWARHYVGERISEALGQANYTFGQLASSKSYLPKLCLVGTDVARGGKRTVYFSADSTPDIKIADAMRITMSFPGLFKPVVVGEEPYVWEGVEKFTPNGKNGELPDKLVPGADYWDPTGVYVDGGVSNQLPAHAFDENEIPLNATESGECGLSDGVLALDLQDDMPPEPASNGMELLGNDVLAGLTEIAATDREFRTAKEQGHRLKVPFHPLSLTNFAPGLHELAQGVLVAAEATLAYFRIPKPDMVKFLTDRTPIGKGVWANARDSRRYAKAIEREREKARNK